MFVQIYLKLVFYKLISYTLSHADRYSFATLLRAVCEMVISPPVLASRYCGAPQSSQSELNFPLLLRGQQRKYIHYLKSEATSWSAIRNGIRRYNTRRAAVFSFPAS